jgi:23S rRNA (pseudouridine1915-N3)-methyltransferase
MRLVVVAVGQRPPAWAEAACDEYARRFPPELRLELKTVKTEPRTNSRNPAALLAAERARIERLLDRQAKGARVVALDEHGDRIDTARLAARLEAWRGEGRDVALLVGGPDGLDPALKAGADERLRLSDLTLPHALARVVLAEALYRAWSLGAGHPYHRE